jgi:hypothetical protein
LQRARDIAPRPETPGRRDAPNDRPHGAAEAPRSDPPAREPAPEEPRSLYLRLRPERRRRFHSS